MTIMQDKYKKKNLCDSFNNGWVWIKWIWIHKETPWSGKVEFNMVHNHNVE